MCSVVTQILEYVRIQQFFIFICKCYHIFRIIFAIFLCSCLTNQTFSRVALLNQKPVGIILGKSCAVHKCPLPLRIRQISSITSLLLSGEGRKTAKIFQDVDGIDKELLKECGTSYPALMIYFNLRKIVNKQILAPFLSAYFSFLLKIMNSKQNSCQKQCHSQS